MRGSPTQAAPWPLPAKLVARALLATAVVLAAAHLIERATVRALIPLARATVSIMDDRITVDDARLARSDGREMVRFALNLSEPLSIQGREAYPIGWRGIQMGAIEVRYWLGGVYGYGALILIVVLAWPARGFRELLARSLLAVPLVLFVLLIDMSLTVIGEFWRLLDHLFAVEHANGLLVWSRLLNGGGGYVLALLLGAAAIALAHRLCGQRPRWQTVSRQDFDKFLRHYERPLEVDPPWERWTRKRYFRDLTLGTHGDGVVAQCRHSRGPTQYRLRTDDMCARSAGDSDSARMRPA